MQCRKCGATLPSEARFCPGCGARLETERDGPGDPLREALDKSIGFQYRIERLLGRGGMGAVYLAHELALDRDVAIKVLPPERSGSPEVRERFRREARTAARLTHPNIVPLYTFGEVDGLVYFVMGYVAGESLASRLKRDGPLAPDAACTLLAEIADALAYAHRNGIVHRDIKPDNILIDADSGSPRLTDFGIAKAGIADAQLTATGVVIGTPAYMSPEQAIGSPDVDARSDLYSLGIVAYETVSGRLPFDAVTPMDALTQRLTQEPRPLRASAPHVADDISVAIDRCLQRDPARRWPDAKSLRFALVPTDDEADDPLAVRLLRQVTAAVAVIAPTLLSAAIFAQFSPRSQSLLFLASMLGGLAFGLGLAMLGATVILLRQGLGVRAIVQATLQQPRSWRFWYPRRFRRRGDVWDRIPASVRRVRFHFALFFCFAVCVFLPLMTGLLLSGRLIAFVMALEAIVVVVLALLFLERSRAVKEIADTLGIGASEAAKLMSTPTSRASVWQRGPAASLLRSGTLASAGPGVRSTAAQATLTGSGDPPTATRTQIGP